MFTPMQLYSDKRLLAKPFLKRRFSALFFLQHFFVASFVQSLTLIISFSMLFARRRHMESMNLNDQQGVEICENVGNTLIEQLDSEDVWMKVQDMLKEYLKNNNINADPSQLIDNLEWSVKVKLRKP
jgi:hypothetical protein